VAEVSRRPRDAVSEHSHLGAELGFDSLMTTELQAALDEAGVPAHLVEQVPDAQTAGDLVRLVGSSVHRAGEPERPAPEEGEGPREAVAVPQAVQALGRSVLGVAQRALYQVVYGARVEGRVHVPAGRNVLVVANHSSHLDMGLVKFALGDQGERLAAMAAADYFFDTPLKRAYFENFTNLIPMERAGSVRRSLRAAVTALERGYNVLIFPEGTRSRDGALQPFKPTAGYLALHCGVDTLPVYLHGTHEALPKGAVLPRQAALRVVIGPAIAAEDLRRRTADLPRGEAHKAATRIMEEAVRALRDRVLRDAAPAAPGAATSPGAPAAPAGDGEERPAGEPVREIPRSPARSAKDQT
jgi:long-chain acyl-CoA synthetase